MAALLFSFASAAPAHDATTSSPFLLPETTLTVAGETPPDCVCCAVTSASMTAYCMREMPMGDLHMANYTCDDHASQVIEVGGEITTRSPQCAAYCNHRLAEVRNDTCGIPCAKVPTCDECVPPPPPPPSAPPPCPPYGTPHCRPVPVPCCEAMLLQLQKFCYSFEPPSGFEAATKLDDADHWDGGMWLPPAPFDWLVDMYAPWQCAGADDEGGGGGCENAGGYVTAWPARFLSLFARQHPEICRSSLHEKCHDFCTSQCAPLPSPLPTPEKAPTPFGAAPFSGKAPLGPWRAALPAGPARFGSTSLLAEQPATHPEVPREARVRRYHS